MSLKLITAPTALAVSLADAKLQLRGGQTAEDPLITRLIRGATARAEHETGRAIMEQEWELILDSFPLAEIELAKPPVLSIVSVKYLDPAGTQQTLLSTAYTLDPDKLPGWLFPAAGTSWPATQDVSNSVRVRFTCGYGNSDAAVPEGIKDWIHVQITTLYDNRDAVALARADADACSYQQHLLDPFRTYL
jgi:uncharacterized phiE125 gp8 family phage protein